jgi:ECF sigma factor
VLDGEVEPTVLCLIEAAENGDKAAAEALFETLYSELRQVAKRELARRGGAVSLSATTLLHEAYLAMSARGEPSFPDRLRFLGYALRRLGVDSSVCAVIRTLQHSPRLSNRLSNSKASVQVRGRERIEMSQVRTTWRLEDELQTELQDAGTMCRIGMKEGTRSETGGICGRIQRTTVTSHPTVYARPLRVVENIKRLRAKLE